MKNILDNPLLVTAYIVGLYPSLPNRAGLRVLKEVMDRREEKKISNEDLVKMNAFVLKNTLFEFNSQIKHQILGMDIGTKFASYTWIFMGGIDLQTQKIHP